MIEAIWTQRKERGTTRGSRPFDYGLIRVKGAGAGTRDLFFHKSNIDAGVESGALKLETRVRFRTSRNVRKGRAASGTMHGGAMTLEAADSGKQPGNAMHASGTRGHPISNQRQELHLSRPSRGELSLRDRIFGTGTLSKRSDCQGAPRWST